MARIRSLHPGQWTDEAFVELSFPARLIAIGLRNMADDNGVFEWKPKQIKMELMPADDGIVVADLLQELLTHNVVKQFEHLGRQFGAIRNFRVWQRPQSPKSVWILPADLRVYVGLEAPTKPSTDLFDSNGATGTPMENQQQMKDEGCKRQDSIGGRSNRNEGEFERFWSAYPKRDGSNPKKTAREKYWRARDNGVSAELLEGAARAYASSLGDKVATQYVAQAVTWLNQERWHDYPPEAAAAAATPPAAWANGLQQTALKASAQLRFVLWKCQPVLSGDRLILVAPTGFLRDELVSRHWSDLTKLWPGVSVRMEGEHAAA